MSTRATVLIKNENTGEKKYLYHHCDGDDLDGDLDNVLSFIGASPWTIDFLTDSIIAYDSAYGDHEVNGIGWDSEFVYVISIRDRTLRKYQCGTSAHMVSGYDCELEKIQTRYLVRELEYGPKGGIASETLPFGDPSTEAARKREKAKDVAMNVKRILDWVSGTMGLDDEGKKMALDMLNKMYNGDK